MSDRAGLRRQLDELAASFLKPPQQAMEENIEAAARVRRGDRDGRKVQGRFWRKVMLLAVDGGDRKATQGATVQRFLDRLVELYITNPPPPTGIGRKIAEATALEYFAAETMPTLGPPKRETPTPFFGEDQPAED